MALRGGQTGHIKEVVMALVEDVMNSIHMCARYTSALETSACSQAEFCCVEMRMASLLMAL